MPEKTAGQPAVTVIVPVRDMDQTLGRTLDSIVGQDYPGVEIIIIEGQSSDATLAVAERYRDHLAQLVSEPDRGYYDAVNKGIALATGEVIGILNGDDYFKHDAVLSHYAAHFGRSDAGIVFGDLEFFPPDDPTRTIRRYSSRKFHPGRLRFGWMPPHPTVFVRKHVYDRVGLYEIDYQIAADFEFLVRALCVHRVPFERMDEVTVRMQYGGISTAGLRASYRLNREIIRACRSNGVYTNWPLVLLKIPAKLREFLPSRSRPRAPAMTGSRTSRR